MPTSFRSAEAIDTSTAGGRMFFHLLGVFAQWEREEIAERVNASVITRAKLGKSINGSAPYGYQWKDRKLIPHPEEAPIRRKAYELFLEHRRKGKVAKLMNAAGYRTRGGVIWRDTQLYRTLIDTERQGHLLLQPLPAGRLLEAPGEARERMGQD